MPSEKQFVTLDIINIRGQYIKSLISGEMTRGIYTFDWDGKDINNQLTVPKGLTDLSDQGQTGLVLLKIVRIIINSL